ncbi:MAG: hypothetical protein AAB370_07890 [Verrucomicrobiota bacterium]
MAWAFDQSVTTQKLFRFFQLNGAAASDFGNRVSQTFEALTFAQVIKWYKDDGWSVKIVNPASNQKTGFRLKFSTRGDTRNFTHVRCEKGVSPKNEVVQIRHQIRVATHYNLRKKKKSLRANIVCDVAILKDDFYDGIVGSMHVENDDLITFVEAKHMNAYAELIAGFIGLVHELQPWRIGHDVKKRRAKNAAHPKPFLNLSGHCAGTAEGIIVTMKRRKMDVAVYDSQKPFLKM